jgi:protein-L-isoaspartate(D-aspartate) O-methyltransferase
MDRKAFMKYYKSLDRALFLDGDVQNLADYDRPLPIGHGQTISQPSLVAQMTLLLDPEPDSRVLEIGTGSGYQTALLAPFCKKVYSIERIPELMDVAQKRLAQLDYNNILYRVGNGYKGWVEEAPFDRIIVAAAPVEVPPALLEQLAPHGRLVIPVGPGMLQDLLLITKDGSGQMKRRAVSKVAFVKLIDS